MDGQSTTNPYDNSLNEGIVSLTRLARARVLQNTYQAEYGRSSGVFVSFITKSGTREYHGSVYSFLGNEDLNANNLLQQSGTAWQSPNTATSMSDLWWEGPIYIPGKFNRNKDKLFFFVSAEGWSIRQPQSIWQDTMPTALERQGEFCRLAISTTL